MGVPRSRCWGRILLLGAFLIGSRASAEGWVAQTCPVSSDLNGVDMLDSATGWIVGGEGTILHTTNGGADWELQVSHATYGLHGVSFLDSSFGLAVGEGGTILRTTNGGADWQVIRTDWMDVLSAVRVVDAAHACAVGTNSIFQPFVGRSTDGGLTWSFTAFYIQGNEGGLTDVDFTDAQNGFASAYLWDGRGAVCRTTNGGASWSTITVVAYALRGIDFADAQVGVACGLAGNVLRSSNGGLNWSHQSVGAAPDLLDVSFPGAATGWVVGEARWIARTTNGGLSWAPQLDPAVVALSGVDMASPLIGTAVGALGTIFRTNSGGEDPAGTEAPGTDRLLATHPNPFTGEVSIHWRSRDGGPMRLVICDVQGRRIRTLRAPPDAGDMRSIRWDGSDDEGRRVDAGIYFVRVDGGVDRARKLVLLD